MTEKHKPQDFFTTISTIGLTENLTSWKFTTIHMKTLQLGEISFTLNTAQQN